MLKIQNLVCSLMFQVMKRWYGGGDTTVLLYPGMQWENSYKPSNSVLDSE